MYPIKLSIYNFMCHNESHIDFNKFSSATIIGKTDDNTSLSNGTGKTSIFKAIDFVVFNEYPTDKAEKVVRDGSDLCKVIFEFEIDQNHYRITRMRNKKSKKEIKLDQLIDGKWESLSQKTDKETEAEIQKLIKINYTSFKNSILFAQGDLSGLASASSTERRKLLKEPLQLAAYSKYEELAKKKRQKLEQEISGVLSLIKNIGNPLSDITLFKSQIEQNKSNLEVLNNKLSNKTSEQDVVKSTITLLKDKLNNSENDLKTKLSLANNKKAKLNSNISECDLNIKKYEKSILSNKDTIKNQEVLYQSYIETENKLKEIELREASVIKADIQNVEDLLKRGNNAYSKNEVKLEIYSKELPTEAVCPECLQNIDHNHREKIKEEYSIKFNEAEARKAEYFKSIQKLEVKLRSLKKELEELYSFNIKNQKLESDIKACVQTKQNFENAIEACLEIIKSNEAKKQDYSNELIILNKEIEDLNNEISKNTDDSIKKELSENENILKNINNELSKLQSEINSINVSIGGLEKSISIKEKDIDNLKSLEDQRDLLNGKLSINNKAVEAFGTKGIPNMIINTILNDLQLESNNLLQELRPDMEMMFITEKDDKETLDIIYRVKGKERDYYQLSGGQRMMVALCLKLGLSIVIQRRLGYDVKFLLLDEVDQPLDKATTIAFADVVKKWQDKFKILVITHNDWLKDRFKHAILVNSTDDGSFAKVVEN